MSTDDIVARLNEAYSLASVDMNTRPKVDIDLLAEAAAEIESLRERLANEVESAARASED